MIEELFEVHKGSNIAVLGSAPSVRLYSEQEDIAIAVNGASLLKKRYKYFITGHPNLDGRGWIKTGDQITRIINFIAAMRDQELFPDEEVRKEMMARYEASFLDFHMDHPEGFKLNYTFKGPLPRSRAPHLLFYYGNPKENKDLDLEKQICREQRELFFGGTSACLAVQAALIMGASEIHLYGCAFDNDRKGPFKGDNYFYEAKPEEFGHTDDGQRKIMDEVIRIVKSKGVDVIAYGETRLQEPTKIIVS